MRTVSLAWLLFIPMTLALVMGIPSSLRAQSLLNYTPAARFLPAIPGLDIANVKLRTTAYAGYQRMGLNFDLPFPISIFTNTDSIDFSLSKADMWVGSAGLNMDLFRGTTEYNSNFKPFVSLFLKATANAGKSVQAVTNQDPLPNVSVITPEGSLSTSPPGTWPNSNLEWWVVDGGALYHCSGSVAIIAGLRRDHLSLSFDKNYAANFPLGSAIGIDYSGGFLDKLWVPYLGLQLKGTNYSGSFIWSPFVSTSLKVPLRTSAFASAPPLFAQIVEEIKFSVFNPGTLSEANFEYDQELTRGIFFGIWGNASQLRIRKIGYIQLTLNTLTLLGPVTTSVTASDSGTATLGRYIVAGGILLEARF